MAVHEYKEASEVVSSVDHVLAQQQSYEATQGLTMISPCGGQCTLWLRLAFLHNKQKCQSLSSIQSILWDRLWGHKDEADQSQHSSRLREKDQLGNYGQVG